VVVAGSGGTAARAAGWLVATALATGLIAEALVRALHPTPRTQVIRGAYRDPTLEVIDVGGTPVWRHTSAGWRTLWSPPCLGQSPKRTLAFVGDSLINVTGSDYAKDNFAVTLQRLLDAHEPGWCVVNLAHFAYSAAQKRAALDELYARAEVDLVVWEVWGEGPTYYGIGESLYSLGNHVRGADGVPYLPGVPVPGALNAALFEGSAAWQYALLALAVSPEAEDVTPQHAAALAAAEAEGARVVFWRFTELSHSLAEPSSVVLPIRDRVDTFLAARGAEVIEERPRLAGQDVNLIRHMDCCHYNPKGHQVLARMFFDWLTTEVTLPED
jgi:hypothetical protein